MVVDEPKISFCTVCMGRTIHLAKTLKRNIIDNSKYPNLEFIVLDYNSTDNLEHFIQDNFANELLSGRLIFFKTFTPEYFNRSHSRNLAFKLASGSIICNIDADNYTGLNFAQYVSKEFKKNSNIFLSGICQQSTKDIYGRICVKKEDFLAVGGYDESMNNYGFEDHDFVNRLQAYGKIKKRIRGRQFFNFIYHTNMERIGNEFLYNNIRSVMINYLSPASSGLLFLFNKNEFSFGTIINNNIVSLFIKGIDKEHLTSKYNYSILEKYWVRGTWNERNDIYIDKMGPSAELTIEKLKDYYLITDNSDKSQRKFYELNNKLIFEEALFFYSQIENRIKMKDNLKGNVTLLNSTGYGRDTVYKNFNYSEYITIT